VERISVAMIRPLAFKTPPMQRIYDIVILTEARFTDEKCEGNANQTVYLEDRLVKEALIKQGLRTIRLSWDDPDFDWSTTKNILFRSAWDYFYRFPEFSKWLHKVSQHTHLLNSEAIIRWNLDKHYLLDLERKGVHIVKTHFIEQGSPTTLKDLHDELGWTDTVLKPCISGTARHTYRLNPQNIGEHEVVFSKLLAEEAMMLLPFQHNIADRGEISMIVLDGKFTHAVLKTARPGDYRVQDNFGGQVSPYNPTTIEINFAENAVKACQELPIYARVDIFTNNDGQTALLELELIEPELWFRYFPQAARILAGAINDKIKLTSFGPS